MEHQTCLTPYHSVSVGKGLYRALL